MYRITVVYIDGSVYEDHGESIPILLRVLDNGKPFEKLTIRRLLVANKSQLPLF